jgi:hypothetical protein
MRGTLKRWHGTVPAELRKTFIHLYLDIAWYGVLSGTAIAFAAVYAARLGASGLQIGLLNAGPAMVGLAVTLPAGRWLERRSVGRAVFWTSVLHRLGYLPWMFLPLLLPAQGQVWTLVSLTLVMSIPGTVLAVGFNAMFAAAVPSDLRGHAVGVRNALLAATYVLTSLTAGYLLNRLPFPIGYQVVFAIGFLGAALSSLHLWFVQAALTEGQPAAAGSTSTLGDQARPGLFRTLGDSLKMAVGLRFLARGRGKRLLRAELLRGRFGGLLGSLFAFHLAQFLAIPLLPLFWVEELRLTDQEISLGMALFYALVFLGSTRLAAVSRRWGNHRVAVGGALVMAMYPVLTAATYDLTLFLITSVIGGLAWSLVGGALGNFILDEIPVDDRPAHLAWYNLALNGAILAGSLLGPLAAESAGLRMTLAAIGVLRLLAALSLLVTGRRPAPDAHAGPAQVITEPAGRERPIGR